MVLNFDDVNYTKILLSFYSTCDNYKMFEVCSLQIFGKFSPPIRAFQL